MKFQGIALKISLKRSLFSRIKNEKSEYTVNVLPSMPQLGAKIRRTGVGADEEESSPVQLHDGETANFELVRTFLKFD